MRGFHNKTLMRIYLSLYLYFLIDKVSYLQFFSKLHMFFALQILILFHYHFHRMIYIVGRHLHSGQIHNPKVYYLRLGFWRLNPWILIYQIIIYHLLYFLIYIQDLYYFLLILYRNIMYQSGDLSLTKTITCFHYYH